MRSHYNKKLYLVSFLLISFTFILTYPTAAQTPMVISIDGIRNENFPELDLFVSVVDEQGYPIPGLTKENFAISEDANVVTDFAVAPISELPLAVVLLVDTSLPMSYGEEPTPIVALCDGTQILLDMLASPDQVGVVSYSEDIKIAQNLTNDKNLVKSAMCSLQVESGRALNDALFDAIDLLEDVPERKAIILVAGNEDSGISDTTFEQAIEEAVAKDILVHTIGWSGANPDDLAKLSGLTHGISQFLGVEQPHLSDIQAAFSNIGNALPDQRTQYHVNFASNLIADNNEHQVNIGVDHLGRHAESSRAFVAVPGEVTVTLPDLVDGQTVGGFVNFAPKVVSPSPLARMEILIDNTPLALVTTPPFEYSWDSSNSTGEHNFAVRVEDTVSNKGEIDLKLIVEPPIIVTIIDPMEGEVINSNQSISVDIDANSKISRIEYYVDKQTVAVMDNPEPPYEVEWDISGATTGQHNILVKASDVNGFTDEAGVQIVIDQGPSSLWVVVIGAVAVAALLIPVGITRRRRRKKVTIEKPSSVTKLEESVPSLQSGQAFLRELSGLNPNRVWPLSATEIRLGRKRDENDIPLSGLKASRQQAVIRMQNDQYLVASLKPENPILVNDLPVYQEQILQPGDQLRAGDTILQFEVKG